MVVYYASSEHTSSELYHHGIKGMHWHERRFQNKDGSLTAAGRVRYGVGQAGRGLAKVAKGASSLATKAGTAAGQGIKKAVAKAKEETRAKKVKKLTATKSDLAKNYDKLTPEERKAALEKFKFQDDLKDSMKKDWDRAVNYAKLTFDAIDTAKKIGDDVSLIATGKNLADLAKARNKDPNAKDKEYWEKELTKNKALQTQETAEKLRLENKKQNAGDVDTYSTGAKNKLERDAAEKAKAEAEEKKVERMQRIADAVDAVQSAPGKIKEKYNEAADKFNDRVNKAYDAASNAAEKGKAAAGKAKDVAADVYNYTGEAVGKAGTAVYKTVNETAPKVAGAAKDVYNYSGELAGKAGTAVYKGVNAAAAKSKSAASLTKAKAEALYKNAGSMAAAAEKAGCSPSTIRNFLGNIKPKTSSTPKSVEPAYKEVKNVQQGRPKDYDSNPSKYTVTTAKRVTREDIDRYNEQLVRNNQEMLDRGMDILNDILKHSGIDAVVMTEEEYLAFSEDDVASLFHGATFFF